MSGPIQKILIIGINYRPEPTGIAPYTTGLAEHLAGNGYQVQVITAEPHYPSWTHVRPRGLWKITEDVENGVKVTRVPIYVPRRQSALRRGLYEFTFLVMANFVARRVAGIDVVLGVVPSLGGGVAAAQLARRMRRPYLLWIQDIVSLSAQESGAAGRSARLLEGILARIERVLARNAKRVLIISDAFKGHFQHLGVDNRRLLRVRNWTHMGPAEGELRRRVPSDTLACLHIGNLGYKQDLETILDCAGRAKEAHLPISFTIVGDGSRREQVQQLIYRRELDNVQLLPLAPADELRVLLATADVFLLAQRDSVRDMALPSKLTTYFAWGRPVVAATNGSSAAAMEIESAGGGIVVQPGNGEEMLVALQRLLRNVDEYEKLQRGAVAYAQNNLSNETCLAVLKGAVDEACQEVEICRSI